MYVHKKPFLSSSLVIYGLNISIAAFWTYVQWWYATKDYRLVDSDLDPTFITIMSRSSLIGPIFYLIAVALSFVSIIVSLVLFMAIPIYYLVPTRWYVPFLSWLMDSIVTYHSEFWSDLIACSVVSKSMKITFTLILGLVMSALSVSILLIDRIYVTY